MCIRLLVCRDSEPEEDDDGMIPLNDSESGIDSRRNQKRRTRYYILFFFFYLHTSNRPLPSLPHCVNQIKRSNKGLFYALVVCYLPSFRRLKPNESETSTNLDSESEQEIIKTSHRYRRCSRR